MTKIRARIAPQILPKGRRIFPRALSRGEVPLKRKSMKNVALRLKVLAATVWCCHGQKGEHGFVRNAPKAATTPLTCAKCPREAAGLIGGPHGFQTAVERPIRACLRVCGRCTGAACNSGSGGPHPGTRECSRESGSNPANSQTGHMRLTAAR